MYKNKNKAEEEEQNSNPYDDERAPKSEAVRFLGEVHPDLDVRMARSRWSLREIPHITMLETQCEALNPQRLYPFLSMQWLHIKSRNHLGINGKWREEMGDILQAAAEQGADELSFKDR
jgi:hypothetical protein